MPDPSILGICWDNEYWRATQWATLVGRIHDERLDWPVYNNTHFLSILSHSLALSHCPVFYLPLFVQHSFSLFITVHVFDTSEFTLVFFSHLLTNLNLDTKLNLLAAPSGTQSTHVTINFIHSYIHIYITYMYTHPNCDDKIWLHTWNGGIYGSFLKSSMCHAMTDDGLWTVGSRSGRSGFRSVSHYGFLVNAAGGYRVTTAWLLLPSTVLPQRLCDWSSNSDFIIYWYIGYMYSYMQCTVHTCELNSRRD